MNRDHLADVVEAIKEHSGMDEAEIEQAGEQGADAGWSGFTYTKDTIEFYDKYEEMIWELLEETSADMGMKPLELVASFRTEVVDVDSFKNLLSWFALEEAGRYLADRVER
jgi:hypothetical protein